MSSDDEIENEEANGKTCSNIVGLIFGDGKTVTYMNSVGVPENNEIIEQLNLETKDKSEDLIKWRVNSRTWELIHDQLTPVLKLTQIRKREEPNSGIPEDL